MSDRTVRLLWWFAVGGLVADTVTTGYGLTVGGAVEANGNVVRVLGMFGTVPGLMLLLAVRVGGARMLVAIGSFARRRELGFPVAEIGLTILAAATWAVVGSNLMVLWAV